MSNYEEIATLTLVQGVMVSLISYALIDSDELFFGFLMLLPLLLMLFQLFILDDMKKNESKSCLK